MPESAAVVAAETDCPQKAAAHPYRSREAVIPCWVRLDNPARTPATQTINSNRSAAGKVHRFAALHSEPAACTGKGTQSNSVRLSNPEIRFRILRVS